MVDLKWKFVVAATAEDLNGLRYDFDVTCCLLRVLGTSLSYDTCYGDRGFLVDRLKSLDYIFILENELGRSVKISYDYKAQAASDFSHILEPADEGYVSAAIGETQLTAVMST